MPDFENIIEDFGSDAKNLVSGDVEIGGKKIPKVVIAGVGVGGLALFLFISKRGRGGGNSSQSADMPGGIGNANPGEQTPGDIGSALDALGNQLGGIPAPSITPPSDIGYSTGDLGGFLNQIPIFGGETNPALNQLPDLSGFNLAIPSQDASNYTNQPYSQLDFPNQSAQVSQYYANENSMRLPGKGGGKEKSKTGLALELLRGKNATPKGIPIKTSASGNALSNPKTNSGILNSLLSGFKFRQTVKPTTTGVSVSGSAIKTGQNIGNLFGGSKPQPVINQGNAVTIKPNNNYFSNIFGSFSPVQSLPKPSTINYGSIGFNWSNPLPLPKPPTVSYGSSGFNWSNTPKPISLPKPPVSTPKPTSGGFSSVFAW